jgi:hypothetical protein
MEPKTTISIRIPTALVRDIDNELMRRRLHDLKGRAVSRTAVILDAINVLLGIQPGANTGAVR